MSVRSDVGVCRDCGAVDLASRMVRMDAARYAYRCPACHARGAR